MTRRRYCENRHGVPLSPRRVAYWQQKADAAPKTHLERVYAAQADREAAEIKRRRDKAKLPSYVASEAAEHVDASPRLIRKDEIDTNRPATTTAPQPRLTFAQMREDLERANPKIRKRAAQWQEKGRKSK